MNRIKKIILLSWFSGIAFPVLPNGPQSAQQSAELWMINRATVDEQKKIITTYLENNKNDRLFTRLAYVSGMCITAGALAYWMMRQKTPAAPTLEVDSKTVAHINHTVSETNKTVGKLEKLVTEKLIPLSNAAVTMPAVTEPIGNLSLWQKSKHACFSAGSNLFEATKWVAGTLGNAITNQGVAVFVGALGYGFLAREIPTIATICDTLIFKPIEKVCHPIDIKWYITTQIDLKKLFESVNETAESLPIFAQISEEDRIHHVTSIIQDINLVTRQLSRLVAFMELQADRINEENKACGKMLKTISDYTFSAIQRVNKELKAILANTDTKLYEKVPGILQTLQQLLQEECRKYYLWERAMLYDITPINDEEPVQTSAA